MQHALLNQQFFTQEQIQQVKNLIQHQFGFQLNLVNVNNIQTILNCRNQKIYKCGFIYLFRKKNGNKDQTLYSLITQLQSHHESCIKQNQKNGSTSEITTPKIRSSSFCLYSGHQTKNSIHSPVSLLQNFQIQNQDYPLKNQYHPHDNSRIFHQEKQQKMYVENQFSILKKQLQFQSKGLISKSTQFHHDKTHITKVNFKCKFDSKCPYLVELKCQNHKNNQNQLLYRLTKINISHLQSCILDDQEIHFNITTRKIDKHMNLLIEIIQEDTNAKPKTVLQKFAQIIEEKNEDFIYLGLKTKLKVRAIKKYFDNSVAKARTMAKQ